MALFDRFPGGRGFACFLLQAIIEPEKDFLDKGSIDTIDYA
jgi:hypothetical protein